MTGRRLSKGSLNLNTRQVLMVIGIIENIAGLIPFMGTQHSVSLDYDSHKEITSSHEAQV